MRLRDSFRWRRRRRVRKRMTRSVRVAGRTMGRRGMRWWRWWWWWWLRGSGGVEGMGMGVGRDGMSVNMVGMEGCYAVILVGRERR